MSCQQTSTDQVDFLEILIELQQEFRDFRSDTTRQLSEIKANTEMLKRQVRNLSLRTTAVESDVAEVDSAVAHLASYTPLPEGAGGQDHD
jgi:hypothetical protein